LSTLHPCAAGAPERGSLEGSAEELLLVGPTEVDSAGTLGTSVAAGVLEVTASAEMSVMSASLSGATGPEVVEDEGLAAEGSR